ncbi:CDP-alcohol phosphatidyltransferase family protein [Acrocarpospora sp. B8E8]|uniref:CDP-alcohol phosphatidyltransferase family protein n=1 Tax=Acrocarpospora sp. B8E8 TaxID=3153572 RepID=UPI00325D9752
MGEQRPDTVAVVLATPGSAWLANADTTLIDRLTEQLAALPVADLYVLSAEQGLAEELRQVAKVARASSAPVAVFSGEVVAHAEALAALLEHPSRSAGALIGTGLASMLCTPVRVEHGRVAAAGNSFHQVDSANASFRGVLQVGGDQLKALALVAEELADLAQAGKLGMADETEAVDLLLAGLVRSGLPVRAARLGALHCDRAPDQAAADIALLCLAEVDEDRARLDAAIKQDDGFFSTYCVSSWSRHLVKIADRLGLTPNAVTGISVGLAAIAAIWFSAGDRQSQLAASVALYLSFVLDCVDGQLARYTRRFSPLGAWLDATFDRVKEYVVYVGLALGYAAGAPMTGTGPGGIWALAVGAMMLQAVRHMIDFSYAGAVTDAAKVGVSWARPHRSLALATDSARNTAAVQRENAIVQLAGKLEGDSVTRWLKKFIVLPIGERMALIAITAGLFNARVTFLALLGWGTVAALYTLTGRIARSLS